MLSEIMGVRRAADSAMACQSSSRKSASCGICSPLSCSAFSTNSLPGSCSTASMSPTASARKPSNCMASLTSAIRQNSAARPMTKPCTQPGETCERAICTGTRLSSASRNCARVPRPRNWTTLPSRWCLIGGIARIVPFRAALQNVARQILVLDQCRQMAVDVTRVDRILFPILVRRLEGNRIKQTLEHRMQAPRADVLGALVHLESDFCHAADTIGREFQRDALGSEQGGVLLGQGMVGLGQDALEIFRRQRGQLHADREAALQ